MGRGSGNGRDEGKVARGLVCGGGSGLSEPGYNGGGWRVGVSAGGGMKDRAIYLHSPFIWGTA